MLADTVQLYQEIVDYLGSDFDIGEQTMMVYESTIRNEFTRLKNGDISNTQFVNLLYLLQQIID